ncbi:hypothetical protein DL89DRAFT_321850 [Linderina pennispora]|uniref:Uncharacterized protein n=1 Tax=Linderina pennispora TaxID=61395 RepID=A0A1Y1WE85_9FUNG|nr:uncharacterized protein DL89DRAFT_321850 [Linderina pennispora]ORX71556.1 hypothetical protein DL89DRAFT_321850 [Linderina pennispora]
MEDIRSYIKQCTGKQKTFYPVELANLLVAAQNEGDLPDNCLENEVCEAVLFLSRLKDELTPDNAKLLVEKVLKVDFDDLHMPKTLLDSRKRTTPALSKKAVTSSAEGARLRQRNLAKMTDEQFEAVASTIQPSLVDNVANFAAQLGMGPPSRTPPRGHQRFSTFSARSTPPAAGDMTVPDRDVQSDSEQSALSTPHVSRSVLSQRLRSSTRGNIPTFNLSLSRSRPGSPLYDDLSPVREPSPSRFHNNDEVVRHTDELLRKNAELKKLLAEANRRLELNNGQHEKRTEELERAVDECRAELTMKRREIEKLRQSERGYIESLHVSETEVEKLGVQLSNSHAQSTDLKRQLDNRAVQVSEANKHIFEHSSEIKTLKASLDANNQQLEAASKEYQKMQHNYLVAKHELATAREYKEEADAASQENANLSKLIEQLRAELAEVRLQLQSSVLRDADHDLASIHRPGMTRVKTLRDELAQTGSGDHSPTEDGVLEPKSSRRRMSLINDTIQASSSSLSLPSDKGVGTTDTDKQELNEDAVRHWIQSSLVQFPPQDLVLLHEVWKRIEYSDSSDDNRAALRRELISVFTAPNKYGLKEAIHSRCNATLTRIGRKNSIVKMITNGQHATAVIILYSVVIFCLGVITASYLNISQPIATSLPFGLSNNTAGAVTDSGDGGMNLVRQILVVDDTPAHSFYPPVRKRSPRSRFGEIMFYWVETLLWDESDMQIPT